MAVCDLEVDVNGEETFMVNKKILTSYSGRLRKIFGKSASSSGTIKVIFHDFPGGTKGFELISRFCYSGGRIQITPNNLCLLHCAAHFMEMSGAHNLMEATVKSLDEVKYWTWDELLLALKQCQDFLTAANSSGITPKCLDCLVGRLSISESSSCPSTSSPESSGIRFSCDTRSTESFKNSFSRTTWWFEELLILNTAMVELVINFLLLRKFDHATISRFLFYYQKSKLFAASSHEKCKVLEAVVDMLYTLDWSSISCKCLFGILRVALHLRISRSCRNKLEDMIGSQLYQATLDNLLIPSPPGVTHLYDVNLVIRLLKSFLSGGICQVSPIRLKKVAKLMDLYIAEVAPDPCLKPAKFFALVTALPESAKESYDEIYRAMDMYLEVHAGLSEEEKQKICCALNCEKFSSETCIHLSQNSKFPSKIAIQILMSQQFKLKCPLQSNDKMKLNIASPGSFPDVCDKVKRDGAGEQSVLYAGKFDHPMHNKMLRSHLRGMQLRVMELEKVCRRMQAQMAKVTKSKVSSHGNTRSLPKLCS